MATIVFPPTEVFLRASPSPPQRASPNDDPAPPKKKAAKPKPTNKQKSAHDAADKPKMSKSRTGCVTCKLKRLKCDETKPTCQQCQRRKVECGGYKRDFKWRSFDETTAKTVPPNQKRRKSSVCLPGPSSMARFSIESAINPPKPSSTSPVSAENRSSVSPDQEQPSSDLQQANQPDSLAQTDIDPALLLASDESLLNLSVDDVDNLLGTRDPLVMSEADPEFDIEELRSAGLSETSGDLTKYKSLREVDCSPDGIDAIALRFDQVTCAILSVMNAGLENPWRSLIWPMAQTSPSLFHALCAMTSFHSARREPQFRLKGHEHMQLCFQNLSQGLRDDSVTLENAIATSITLAFAHCWNELTSSGNVYIKGARSIIGRALTEHRNNPRHGSELARLKFLCNAWVYLDVIVRLTCTDEDEGDDYEEIFSAFSNPGVAHNGFGIDFGLPIDARLDPLMGCANTLFPLIGRTANLSRRVRRSAVTSLAVIDQARELKDLLEAWRPPPYIQPPEDASSTVEHSVQTAEAYRWATLLYLHQTVPEIPMATSSQLAAKVLVLLATVPLTSRFVIVHIFPLMAAGCEAVSEEDREWVRHRWAGLGQRLDIGTIDKCIELTAEVWRRRDEVGPLNRQSLVSTNSIQRRQSYDLNPPAAWVFDGSFPAMDASLPMRADSAWPQVLEWDGNPGLDSQYYLGGRLHWLGVMKEWGWEVLLG